MLESLVMAPKSALLIFAVLLTHPVFSATLPKILSEIEIDHIVEVLGAGGSIRMLRSAETYPLYPGLKVGLEAVFIPSKDLNELGDKMGSLPGINIIPRVFVSKGLPFHLELSLCFFPRDVFNTLSTYGGILKWNFIDEKENWAAFSSYAGFTHLFGLDSAYRGNDVEWGIITSKDFVRLKPYLGMGILLAHGIIADNYSASAGYGTRKTLIHAFIGTEIEYPANLTLQIDFMNFSPMWTLFVGKKF